ncbi:hypothetical protein B9Z55_000077 [Caenorhabditis nigoni]|nr:hypothetical protein B9Z55_000077 [Caenorhabditis nigoni]
MKTKVRRSGDSFWIDRHKNSMIASNKWRQDLILRNLFYEQEIQQIKEKLDDAHKALSHKRKAFTFHSQPMTYESSSDQHVRRSSQPPKKPFDPSD